MTGGVPATLVLGADEGLGLAVARTLTRAGRAPLRVWVRDRARWEAAIAAAKPPGTSGNAGPRDRAERPEGVASHGGAAAATNDVVAHGDIDVFEGSMRDHALARRALDGVSLVFHCLPFRPSKSLGHLLAAAVLLDAARPERAHVVYPGSLWVVGLVPPDRALLRADDDKHPRGHLARELRRVERDLRAAWEVWDVPYTVVRLPDLVGPGLNVPPFGHIWDHATRGRAVRVAVRPDVPREMIHVDDAARALLAVGGRQEAFGAEFLAPGGIVGSARDLVLAIAAGRVAAGAARDRPPAVHQFTGAASVCAALVNPDARAFSPLRGLYERTVRVDPEPIAVFGYEPTVTLATIAAGTQGPPP